jgi:uncharacterized protein
MKNLFIPAAIGLAAVASVPAHSAGVEIEAQGPVIELSVYESVNVDPDLATIGAGVTTEAPTATEALRQNSAEMRRVIDRIKQLGISEKDIQTTGINLNARYDYDREDQRQVFRGYQVSNRVSVKLRKIADTGKVLDELVSAGATDLSGPSFSIENDEKAKDAARKRAVEHARERAEAYASMFGYSGVRVLQVSESVVGRGPMPMTREISQMAKASDAPVEPGQVETGVSVSITFEMTGGRG